MVLNTYEHGKRKPKWISTGLDAKGNKRKAEEMLRKEIVQQEQGQITIVSDMQFSDAIRQWLRDVALRVDAITLQGYETLAKSHILPYFDALGIKLADINRMVLQQYINEKHVNGRMDGHGGLSPASLRLHKNILYQTLQEAVCNEVLTANPCSRITLPQAQRHEGKFYAASQLQGLLDAIKDERLHPLVYITAMYGLRRSEVLGLQWDSINLEEKLLTIKHTVVKVTQVVEKDKTKNASSYRSFPLTPDAQAIFTEMKQQECENCKAFGREYHNNPYVFKWENGLPYTPDYISHAFSKLLKKYGFAHIRFHELRHSCASILIASGCSLKDVQEWLGHSDIKITANIYAHLDVGRKKSMANEVQKLLKTQKL